MQQINEVIGICSVCGGKVIKENATRIFCASCGALPKKVNLPLPIVEMDKNEKNVTPEFLRD